MLLQRVSPTRKGARDLQRGFFYVISDWGIYLLSSVTFCSNLIQSTTLCCPLSILSNGYSG